MPAPVTELGSGGLIVGRDKHERLRRGEVGSSKAGRYATPPRGESWIWLTFSFLDSVAFGALSRSAIMALMRLLLEHMAHAGTMNGRLVVTHRQFADYGIRQASVAGAIRELEYFGFIDVERGRAYRGQREPSIFRLTCYADHMGAPATNRWKAVTSKHVENWKKKRKDRRCCGT
ncbi:hypothetical protein [Pseudohoeflea coraliihabitans]|uniref:Helix-turn-helix domain-containing protein n=1 Tax=Pseudohoeflea coraliihabitans TaxID=2860393 RepID=A0ABS6WPN3_9HYPH|nr:hypothetical protein [Pseudohoeflea sp. DP4N28-3]MBW3097730.1 hypothetical protein [Pseudohoeflea sp. DP4N28-3]